MSILRNVWRRSMSEDVNAPELRAQDAFEAKINRRPPREKREIRLPVMCFYRDLYRAL